MISGSFLHRNGVLCFECRKRKLKKIISGVGITSSGCLSIKKEQEEIVLNIAMVSNARTNTRK